MLHILLLLCWSSILIYLPSLIANSDLQNPNSNFILIRKIFTLFMTPSAMLTIISGTLLFVFNHMITQWLILKLTLVSLLVLCHILTGFLIFKIKNDGADRSVKRLCLLLELAIISLIIAITWVVLKKPL